MFNQLANLATLVSSGFVHLGGVSFNGTTPALSIGGSQVATVDSPYAPLALDHGVSFALTDALGERTEVLSGVRITPLADTGTLQWLGKQAMNSDSSDKITDFGFKQGTGLGQGDVRYLDILLEKST